MFLRVNVTGSSKLLIFTGCSEIDVISDSILPKSRSSSVGSKDLKIQGVTRVKKALQGKLREGVGGLKLVHRQEKNLLVIGIRLHQVFEVTERHKRYILSLACRRDKNAVFSKLNF